MQAEFTQTFIKCVILTEPLTTDCSLSLPPSSTPSPSTPPPYISLSPSLHLPCRFPLSLSGAYSTRATGAQSVDLEPIRNVLAVLAAVVKQVTHAQTHTPACRAANMDTHTHTHTHTHTQTHIFTLDNLGNYVCRTDLYIGLGVMNFTEVSLMQCTAQGCYMCVQHITQPPHLPYRNGFPYQSAGVRTTDPSAHRVHQDLSLEWRAMIENAIIPFHFSQFILITTTIIDNKL